MRLTFALIAASVVCGPLAARQTLPAPVAQQVDIVFAKFDRPDVPGCAVGVFQNGVITYAKGYGSANLEYGVPITQTTSVARAACSSAASLTAARRHRHLEPFVIGRCPDSGQMTRDLVGESCAGRTATR